MERNHVTKNIIVQDNTYFSLTTKCIICGESVPISDLREAYKVCDKCKRAVLHIRDSMEMKC